MNNIKKIFTNEFGQKVIIKRFYIDDENISKERLFLLARFLNINNVSLKKLYKLNGSSTFFKAYNYSNGYAFEARLFVNNQSNFLLKSYTLKKAIKLFKDIFEKGFEKDDPLLARLKNEIVDEHNSYKMDSFFFMESNLNLPYSKIDFDDNNLKNVSTSDLLNTLSLINKRECQESIYIGQKENKFFFDDDLFFKSKRQVLPLDYNIIDNITYNYDFENETLANAYTFKSIENMDDFYKTYVILKAICNAFENALADFLLKCHSTIRIISKNKAVILYKFDLGNLYKNSSRIIAINNEISKEDIEKSISDSIRSLKLSQISLNSDLSTAIKRALLLCDLDLNIDNIFADISYLNDDIYQKIDDIKKVNSFAIMKGREEDDKE